MKPIESRRRRVPVLIASWLDQRHVDRIMASQPKRISVMYEPDLLPTPRYEADHHGVPRELADVQRRHWEELLTQAEVSFEFDWERPVEMLQRAPDLRWVQATSSGIGPLVEQLGLRGSQLRITNAAGIHAQPLAEFALMAALYFAKEMPIVSRWKDECHWERFCGNELAGSRLVLIGIGKVGTRIAELFSAVGVQVIGHRRSTGHDIPPGVTRLVDAPGLDDALINADVLVLAAPETPETANILNRRRLELLPQTAVVINVGRGSLVDEPALVDLLQRGRLRGAALDVFAREPLSQLSPLWSMDNVIISPHSASTVRGENDRLTDLFIENLSRYLDARPLVNEYNHDRRY